MTRAQGIEAKILQTTLNAALMLMAKEQLHEATRQGLQVGWPSGSPAASKCQRRT